MLDTTMLQLPVLDQELRQILDSTPLLGSFPLPATVEFEAGMAYIYDGKGNFRFALPEVDFHALKDSASR